MKWDLNHQSIGIPLEKKWKCDLVEILSLIWCQFDIDFNKIVQEKKAWPVSRSKVHLFNRCSISGQISLMNQIGLVKG